MFEIILIIIAMAVVCSALCGIAAFAWTEVSERKLKKRIAKSEEKITALGDWQLMHATKLNQLQAHFTELVYRQDRELWKKLGLTKPDGYERVQIKVNTEDAEKQIMEINEKAMQLYSSISTRIANDQIKPAWYYEEFHEPLVMATYPDQISGVKRGSLGWINHVMIDLRGKVETATGIRKEALERAVQFCESLLKRKEDPSG